MKIEGWLFVAVIIIQALIPGAYADSLGGGVSASSMNEGHTEGIILATNNAAISQVGFTNSDVNYNNWLDDATGKQVKETFNVVQGTGTYNFEFKKGSTIVEPTDPTINHLVPASQSLSAKGACTVTTAKEIKVDVGAHYTANDWAAAGVAVTTGSLIGYTNSANVKSGNAKVTQTWKEATGDVITLGSSSGNQEGDTARAIIDNGDVDNIISSIKDFTDSAETTVSRVSATQSAKSILGNYYIDVIGQNKLFNSAGVFATIQGTTTSHKSIATASIDSTNAKFSATEISDKGSIWTDSYIDYTNPAVMTSVSTRWDNAKIKSFSNEAKTNIITDRSTGSKGFQVEGSQKIGYASGDSIQTGSNAEGLDGCKSSTQTETITGILQGYSDYAVALKKPLPASMANSGTTLNIKSASGSSIAINSTAENLAGDKSITSAQLTDSTISGFSSTSIATPYETYGKEKLTANVHSFNSLSRSISRPNVDGKGVFSESSTAMYRRGLIDYQTAALASQDLALANQEGTCKMISNGGILSMVYTSDYTSPPFTPISIKEANIWAEENGFEFTLEAELGPETPSMLYTEGVIYPPSDLVEQKTNISQKMMFKQSVSGNGKGAVIDSNSKAPINPNIERFTDICAAEGSNSVEELFRSGIYLVHQVHVEI